MRARCTLLLLTALALPAASPSARADEPTIRLQPTEGTELSKKDEAAVRKTLVDYMAALQTRDYSKAGEMLDRPSVLAAVDPMVTTIASDSTHYAAAMTRIFGVSTRDSIEARSTGRLFESLMAYMMELNPSASEMLSKASIEVLAARRMGDRVHVAYQVSLPPSEPGGMPYEQITAQRMTKTGGKWRILFSIAQ
ncbi:MAG: hypothetical protein ABI960_08405 [Candidatus Eisenbacteria bacterium]